MSTAAGDTRTALRALEPGRIGALAVLVALVAGLVVGAWPTVRGLHGLWLDSYTYAHGYLVLAMAGWLAWTALERAPVRLRPNLWFGVPLASATLVYFVAEGIAVQIVQQAILPLALLAGLGFAGGASLAALLALPVLYVYFAVPVWDVLTQPLQDVTTVAVGAGLHLTGIPAFIEGNFVHIPAGTFEIAGGCSGLHFFIVGGALAAFYGLAWYRRWWPRIALGAAALALAMLTNWIRVYVIIVRGHQTEMQTSLIADHYWFGWILFVIVLAPLFVLARWLERFDGDPRKSSSRAPGHPAPGRRVAVVTGLGALILASPALLAGRPAGPVPETPQVVELPAAIGAWQRLDEPRSDWSPRLSAPAFVARADYGYADDVVGLHAGHYPWQRQGHEAVFYANRPYGADRQVVGRRGLDVGGIALEEFEVGRGGDRRLVWRWYRMGDRITATELGALQAQVLAVLGGRRDGTVYAVSAACGVDCEGARAAMDNFVEALFAEGGEDAMRPWGDVAH